MTDRHSEEGVSLAWTVQNFDQINQGFLDQLGGPGFGPTEPQRWLSVVANPRGIDGNTLPEPFEPLRFWVCACLASRGLCPNPCGAVKASTTANFRSSPFNSLYARRRRGRRMQSPPWMRPHLARKAGSSVLVSACLATPPTPAAKIGRTGHEGERGRCQSSVRHRLRPGKGAHRRVIALGGNYQGFVAVSASTRRRIAQRCVIRCNMSKCLALRSSEQVT